MNQNRMDEFSVAIDPVTGELRHMARARWRPLATGVALVVACAALVFVCVLLLEAL